MKRRLFTLLAVIILTIGVISMVTPIPGGTFFIAIGLTLLISVSPPARFCIKWLRARFNWFNKFFSFIENKVGAKFESVGKTLKLTDPGDLKANLKHSDFIKSQIEKEKVTEGSKV